MKGRRKVKIDFTYEELQLLRKLKKIYSLPEFPSAWDYKISELYRDAANDFEVIYGLDDSYDALPEAKIASSVSDKLLMVE
ncbi:MAG: hypothetical protein Q4P08_06260 [Eubacteriales bacterium]|nr:hypothetical protein [Eubacteriales bacterium]